MSRRCCLFGLLREEGTKKKWLDFILIQFLHNHLNRSLLDFPFVGQIWRFGVLICFDGISSFISTSTHLGLIQIILQPLVCARADLLLTHSLDTVTCEQPSGRVGNKVKITKI